MLSPSPERSQREYSPFDAMLSATLKSSGAICARMHSPRADAALVAEMLAQPRRPPVKRTHKALSSTRRPRGTQ
jgi:hypothetical protein